MQFPEPFSTRLKTLREKRGLSQIDLERLCRLAKGTVSRLESGTRGPKPQTLAALERGLALEKGALSADTDRIYSNPPLPRWAHQFTPSPAWTRPEHTIETRMETILKSYPRLSREALAELARNPYQPQLALLYKDWRADSALEGLLCLRVTGRSALPGWVPPGFRRHAVICERTQHPVLDRPHPCLALESPVRSLWFPQVTLRLAERYSTRVDALVCLGPDRWVVVEVDGEGHRNANDLKRDDDLGIPVLRLDAADVQSRQLPQKLGEWLQLHSR